MTTTPRKRARPATAPVSPAIAPVEHEENGPPSPAIAGTFAAYWTPDGGVALVVDAQSGSIIDRSPELDGVHRRTLPPTFVRLAMMATGHPDAPRTGAMGKVAGVLARMMEGR